MPGDAEHRRVRGFNGFAVPDIHMHTAGQAWVEAADSAHNVDALEILRTVLFENRAALHGVLVGPRCPIYVPRAGIPGRRRIWMIVGDLAASDNQMMRQHAAHRLMEAAADGLIRYFEIRPGGCSACLHLGQRLLDKIIGRSRAVSLKIGARAVTLDRIAEFRDLPFEFPIAFQRGLRQGRF